MVAQNLPQDINQLHQDCLERVARIRQDFLTRERSIHNVYTDARELDGMIHQFYQRIEQENDWELDRVLDEQVPELYFETMMNLIHDMVDMYEWPDNENFPAPALGGPPGGEPIEQGQEEGVPVIPHDEQVIFIQALQNLMQGYPVDQREAQFVFLMQPQVQPPLNADHLPIAPP